MRPDGSVILGIGVDKVTLAEAADRVEGFMAGGKPRWVATPNAEMIYMAQRDPALRRALLEADLAVPDGIGVVVASRILGDPVPERVPGIDLARELIARAAAKGYRVFLLGAAPGVAEAAARRLSEEYPGLQVAGTHHGYFGPEESETVIEAIRAARPHLLLVAMGVPKQETWIHQHIGRLGVPAAMGVGGAFDVFAGRVQRAPVALRRLGLEWLYRIAREPRRLGRATALPKFLAAVLAERLAVRGDGR